MKVIESAHCALCEIRLSPENSSDEHIVLNAFGGRKRVQGFVCHGCNSESGATWDAALIKQLAPLIQFLGIKRQRGEPPTQTYVTASGREVSIEASGRMTMARPEFNARKEDESVRLRISARSRQELKLILRKAQRKYPKLTDDLIEQLVADASHSATFLDEPIGIPISFGDHMAGRSLVKAATALAVDSGVRSGDCDLAINYLRGDDQAPCFDYYYKRDGDVIVNRPTGIPFNCVYVRGDSREQTLVAYVEYFGFLRTLMCLSETWNGEDFESTYAFDPLTGKGLQVSVELKLSSTEIKSAVTNGIFDDIAFREAIDGFVSICYRRSFDRALQIECKYAAEIISEVIRRADGNPTRENLAGAVRGATDHLAEFLRTGNPQ